MEELAMFNNSTVFIGIDHGEKISVIGILDKDGEVIEERYIPTTKNAFSRKFSNIPMEQASIIRNKDIF